MIGRVEGPPRRFFAPEVIQIAQADCGPAALKCLLEGFGVPVSYGRLREACQTDVDGSSIDDIEDVAVAAGLDAMQVVVPKQHLLLPESRALPGIVVVYEPSGGLHFNVLWRVHGPFVQLMDPIRGRRWSTRRAFLSNVFLALHPMTEENAAHYLRSDEFAGPLQRRLELLGCLDRCRAEVERAFGDRGWLPLAALDAVTVAVETLVDSKAARPGAEAARALSSLYARILTPGEAWRTVPTKFWSMFPGPRDGDGEPTVLIQGAAVIRVRGRRSATEPMPAAREIKSAELAAALTEEPVNPAKKIFEFIRAEGLFYPALIIAGTILYSAATVFEAILFRALLQVDQVLDTVRERLAAVGAIVLFALLMLVFSMALWRGILRVGRKLEMRLRIAFMKKLPRLTDRYLSSRLVADMAERAHKVNWLAHVVQLSSILLLQSSKLVITVIAIAWLDPSSALPAMAVAASSVLVILAAQPFLAERDMRIRSHVGAMGLHYLDALQGMIAIRAHGGESAMRNEHEIRVARWARSDRGYVRAMVAVWLGHSTVGFAATLWLVLRYIDRNANPAGALVLLYWTLWMPQYVENIANAIREHWLHRSMALRMFEPLGALEDPGVDTAAAPPVDRSCGVAIAFRSVRVVAAGQTILDEINLAIAPGTHVAIVGESGAGKSSLMGTLLGWHRPAEGFVEIDGERLEGGALQRLREETAWVDPAVQLWNRSLLANLEYGSEADGRSLVPILTAADLTPVLERLPDGLQSELGEGGALVSGGEGQRVRLGRALLRKNVRLVLLDEPFRGLDRTTRRALLDRLSSKWRRATLLCITHDIAETAAFDRVLVVHEGRVVEDDTPRALLGRPGSRYRAMFEEEERVRRELWGAELWRRIRVDRSGVHEGLEIVDDDDTIVEHEAPVLS